MNSAILENKAGAKSQMSLGIKIKNLNYLKGNMEQRFLR